MKITKIANKLDKKELLKWEVETKSILGELNWKLVKTERTFYLHQTALEQCKEKLQANLQRAAETRMALQFLSDNHPLRAKCEDDLYKTEISIFRLENKLKRFSSLKTIQLEMKKIIVSEEIKYYEGVLQEIKNLLHPPVVLRRILNTPDGEAARNAVPDEENIFPISSIPSLRGIVPFNRQKTRFLAGLVIEPAEMRNDNFAYQAEAGGN